MYKIQTLNREQVVELWEVDRSEIIRSMYRMSVDDDSGKEKSLLEYPEYHDVKGFSEEDIQLYTPILIECFDRDGYFYVIREDDKSNTDRLGKIIGCAVLDSKRIGVNGDLLQLLFFYVGADQRGKGLGKLLFKRCIEQLKNLDDVNGIYISSIPAKNTVDFYLSQGCQLIDTPDPELYKREPEDIHLIFKK
ncbi:hypothetical protein PPL_10937 [Heterostelium album PN500]|uniref:N-acetyltransferase domain-containing protein n=1 Tax=Heterostelium pallidum (strain ATCC 26659 / Pp 5 / PN500) TaxID=670386 RepID=D3BSG9_HETP5|nr:hypothetical protein PPL_10937 [Heterostelium album PN500]EFA75675.1 hypothetical protein PPL_10937 [Heterostelium album PN500]|eukprot:XP_020427809.1 hypothetical protein PPL_10937 [Heterostelium album PN500]